MGKMAAACLSLASHFSAPAIHPGLGRLMKEGLAHRTSAQHLVYSILIVNSSRPSLSSLNLKSALHVLSACPRCD